MVRERHLVRDTPVVYAARLQSSEEEGWNLMSHHDESRHDLAFIAGVVVGAISGALATLALTPMSGSETREKIRTRAAETDLTPMKERASSVASSAQQMVATGRDKVVDLAAKSPLPVGSRHSESSADGSSPHDAHAEEPAEGRRDTSASSRDSAGRTPHTTDPAEGSQDAGTSGATRPGPAFKPIGSSSSS